MDSSDEVHVFTEPRKEKERKEKKRKEKKRTQKQVFWTAFLNYVYGLPYIYIDFR